MIEAALEGGFPFFDTAQKLGSGGLLALKSGCSVLEKLSLPLVKYRRMDAVLLAQIRNSSAFNQMLAKNRYLLLRAKKTSVIIVHRGPALSGLE